MTDFILDTQLNQDSFFLGKLDLCQLRLSNNAHFPWLILVPERNDVSEIFELNSDEKTVLFNEIDQVSLILKEVTDCDKINIGALGNIVSQLHIHVIARFKHDAAWPKPVWGNANIAYTDPIHAVNYWREKLAVLV